jgi:tetratricopeptide (TPR) repeat protein
MLPPSKQLLRFNFVRAVFAVALISLLARAQDQTTGELRGKVCVASGQPVASIHVVLRREGEKNSLEANTDPEGNYKFTRLEPGLYTLETSSSKFFLDASVSSISIAAGQSKTQDLRLELRPAPAPGTPDFYDQPQFTVSGVTDTSNLGGHASEPIMRNREAVEKDVASLGVTSSVPSPSSPPNAYDLALSYANAGDYTDARDQLVRLSAQQQTSTAHHLLAVVDEKLGNSLEAVHEYQQAAELDPNESNTFDWGSELLLHHAAEPAIAVFANGNRLFPGSTRMLIGLGSSEFAAGFYERAAQRLCQASDLHPENPIPYQFLGKIQRTEGNVSPEVIDRFHRFQRLDPDNADANYLYAVALWKQNQPILPDAIVAQVESLLNTAVRIDPKFAEAYLQLGILHSYQHDSAASMADFQRAITNQPDLEEAHYRLAQAYRAAGKTNQAKSEIARFEQLRQQSALRIEREHREIKQFVYSLRDKPAAPAQ